MLFQGLNNKSGDLFVKRAVKHKVHSQTALPRGPKLVIVIILLPVPGA